MAENPESLPLSQLQMAFAAHLRDPENHPAPENIEPRRMQIYRRLFFNNIRNLLAGNFPVIRSLYDDAGWERLVRAFYSQHRAQTPLFPEVSKEFLRYLQDGRPNPEHGNQGNGDPPFLLELAHYEWVELALAIDEQEIGDLAVRQDNNLLDNRPVLSPLAWPLSYRYPVHRIRPDFRPDQPPPEPTHLLIYRNRADEVRFMELNSITRLLLSIMQENAGLTGRELLQLTAKHSGHPNPGLILEKGLELMRDLLARDVLLGVQP